MPPELVGNRYEIVRELGRGGMGAVLLARQINLGRLVVVKRVIDERPKHVRALLEEARVAARLHHPCIVSVLDVSNNDEPGAFVAMEYVAGMTLREMLQITPDGLGVEVALQITLDVLRALSYAHGVKQGTATGIVHRDVKPRNVMVTFAGDTKLIDFGISRWLSSESGDYEATSIAGTFGYMAPEQQLGKRVDGRTDQFAAAVVLREMLTGVGPREPEATMDESPSNAKRSGSALMIELGLAEIIARATAEDAADRYPDCATFAAALEAHARTRNFAVTPKAVAQWMLDHAEEKIDAWEHEAERGSISSIDLPLEGDVATVTIAAGKAASKSKSASIGGSRAPTDSQSASQRGGTDSQATPRRRASDLADDARDSASASRAGTDSASAASRRAGTDSASASRRGGTDSSAVPLSAMPRSETTPGVTGSSMTDVVPRRGARLLPFVVVGIVAVGGAIAFVALRNRGAAGPPPTFAIAAKNAGAPEDAWLAVAAEHVVRRALRDVDHRAFYLAAPNAAATRLEVAVHRTADGVDLELRGIHASGASLVEAAAQLATTFSRSIDGEPVGPDAIELKAMQRTGATSFDLYRRVNEIDEDSRIPGFLDQVPLLDELASIEKQDPTWGRAYVARYSLTPVGPDKDVLALAKAKIDPERDPVDASIIAAFELVDAGKFADAEKIIAPIYRADPTDMNAGETLVSALVGEHRAAEANAVKRAMHELHPELTFTGDVADELSQQGRDEQAAAFIRDVVARRPDSLTAARQLVGILAHAGDEAGAREMTNRMVLVHGLRALVLAELFDAMILADQLDRAQGVVDRMLLGSPLGRARGHYRNAVLAVFQGRFGAAIGHAEHAIADYKQVGSSLGEMPQSYQILRGLGGLAGDGKALADATDHIVELASRPSRSREDRAMPTYQAALAHDPGTCPAIEPLVADLDPAPRELAMRDIIRIASRAGCAKCDDVVKRGFAPVEDNTESLVAFGLCAYERDQLDLSRRAFEQASRLWSSWASTTASPYFAVLAEYHLARTLAKSGDAPGAIAHYQRFVHFWGHADRPIPEVADAERAIAALRK